MQKQAVTPYVAGISPEAAVMINSLKAEAVRRAVKAGLIGLATGAGAGLTLTGLASWLGKKPKPSLLSDAVDVDVPYPQKRSDWADSLVSSVMPTSAGSSSPVIGTPAWLRDGGVNNTSVAGIPWAIPATIGVGAAGLAGGYQLARWLLHRKYKGDLQRELSRAKSEYDAAMLSQYDRNKIRPLLRKEAAANESTLDTIYHAIDKAAMLGLPSFDQLAGTAAGLGLTGAGTLAVGTAIGAASLLRHLSKSKAVRDAIQRRALIRDLQHPPEVYLRPVPVEDDEEAKKSK